MPDSKLFALAGLLSTVFWATLLTGCGSSAAQVSSFKTPPIETDPSTIELPDGVSKETWALVCKAFNQTMDEAQEGSWNVGGLSRVNDLELAILDGGLAEIGWSYRNDGDYNFDGETNLADLVEIVVHFGSGSAGNDWTDAIHADGDGNGEVGLSDVSVIAKNFSTIVHSYVVETSLDPQNESGWVAITQTTALPAGSVDEGGRPIYTKALDGLENGTSLRVVPQITVAGNPELIPGPPSNTKLYGIGEWLTARHDSAGTGRSPFSGPSQPGIKWVVDGIGAYDVEMFIPADGSIRLIPRSNNWDWDQEMLVISPDGETTEFPPPSAQYNVPRYMFSDCSYVTRDKSRLIARLDTNYSIMWKYPPQALEPVDEVYGGPGGKVFFRDNKEVGCLTADGELLWSQETENSIFSLAVREVSSVVCSTTHSVFSFDGIDLVEWEHEYSIPKVTAIGSDGSILFLTGGGLTCLSADLEFQWSADLEYTPSDEVAIGPEGNIFVTTEYGYPYLSIDPGLVGWRDEHKLHAFSPDGVLLWEFSPQRRIISTIVDAAGTVYLATKGALFAINPDGEEAWRYTTDMDVLRMAISPDGTLYAYLRTQLPESGPPPPPGPGVSPSSKQVQNMNVNGLLIEGKLIAFGPGNIPLPPDAPTGLNVSDGEFGSYLLLNWNPVPEAAYYRIFRDNKDNMIGTVDHGTAWVDWDMHDWDYHEYWVRAVGNTGAGALSLSDVGSITRGPASTGRGDWYMEGRGPRRSYQSGVAGPVSGELAWRINVNTLQDPSANGSMPASTPVMGSDGTIFVAGSKQYALWPDGSIKWTYKPWTYMTYYIGNTSAMDNTGTLFIGGSLEHRVSANGIRVDPLDNDDEGVAPLLNPDGSVVYAEPYGGERGVIMLGPDGTEIWNFFDGMVIEHEDISTMVVKSPAGNYLFGTDEGYIYALDENGEMLWVADPTEEQRLFGGNGYISSVTCGNDNSFVVVADYYFPAGEGGSQWTKAMLKYSQDGNLLWALDLAPWGSHYDSGPAIGSSGNIYIAADPAQVNKSSPVLNIRHDGNVLFQFDTHGKVIAPVILDADENVFICANLVEIWPSGEQETVVFALDSSGSQLWSYIVEGAIYNSPAIGNDGTLYVPTETGNLYAFRDQ